MVKAGLIGAAIGFVLAIVATLLLPFCDPCVAMLVGAGIGFLAAAWERPADQGSSAGAGAKAGAIATAGSLLGQMIGAVINGFLVGPQGAAELARQLGLPYRGGPRMYWAYNIGGNCLCGLFGLLLGAALGAVGGLLWYQIRGQKSEPPTEVTERVEGE
ncbi:MAG TPA: hypothetical protein ENK08_05555 [Chloroflexi bacterium]|nr:hypothetical protein [Chloroflexota bacterium]